MEILIGIGCLFPFPLVQCLINVCIGAPDIVGNEGSRCHRTSHLLKWERKDGLIEVERKWDRKDGLIEVGKEGP